MNWMLVLFCLVFFPMVSIIPGFAAEKVVIGAEEEVVLLPWNVKIPARIDTGATLSSIDVCDYAVRDEHVDFTLADRCGGHKVHLPLIGWKEVRTSEGMERRPIVQMELCLGPYRMLTQFTINDRSSMEFPILIGRNTLQGKFVVDVESARLSPPNCPIVRKP